MRIAMNMSMQENHLCEYIDEHICAVLSAAELLVETFNVVNLYAFDVLHKNGPLSAFQNIDGWNVKVVTIADIAEIVDGLL